MPYYIKDFIPKSVPLYEPFEPLPKGGYDAIIENIEIKTPFQDEIVSIKFRIDDHASDYNNRIAFIDLRINDSKEKARDFARKILNQICTACDIDNKNEKFLDAELLINKKIHIYLDIYTNTKNKRSNTINGASIAKNNITDDIPFFNDNELKDDDINF